MSKASLSGVHLRDEDALKIACLLVDQTHRDEPWASEVAFDLTVKSCF